MGQTNEAIASARSVIEFFRTPMYHSRSCSPTRTVKPRRGARQPADIAGPAAFLCGPDSAYITGHILCVDGGLSATF